MWVIKISKFDFNDDMDSYLERRRHEITPFEKAVRKMKSKLTGEDEHEEPAPRPRKRQYSFLFLWHKI